MHGDCLYGYELGTFSLDKDVILLVIPKTGKTTESMQVVNFEIHLLPNCNFFMLQVFYNCSKPWMLQHLYSLILI
jgi:hypothetical protein